jgi:hypothetical protein
MIKPYDAWNSAARLVRTITDLAPTTYASGEVGLDDESEISTYTVASGDTAYGIGNRLCIDYITVPGSASSRIASQPHRTAWTPCCPKHRPTLHITASAWTAWRPCPSSMDRSTSR